MVGEPMNTCHAWSYLGFGGGVQILGACPATDAPVQAPTYSFAPVPAPTYSAAPSTSPAPTLRGTPPPSSAPWPAPTSEAPTLPYVPGDDATDDDWPGEAATGFDAFRFFGGLLGAITICYFLYAYVFRKPLKATLAYVAGTPKRVWAALQTPTTFFDAVGGFCSRHAELVLLVGMTTMLLCASGLVTSAKTETRPSRLYVREGTDRFDEMVYLEDHWDADKREYQLRSIYTDRGHWANGDVLQRSHMLELARVVQDTVLNAGSTVRGYDFEMYDVLRNYARYVRLPPLYWSFLDCFQEGDWAWTTWTETPINPPAINESFGEFIFGGFFGLDLNDIVTRMLRKWDPELDKVKVNPYSMCVYGKLPSLPEITVSLNAFTLLPYTGFMIFQGLPGLNTLGYGQNPGWVECRKFLDPDAPNRPEYVALQKALDFYLFYLYDQALSTRGMFYPDSPLPEPILNYPCVFADDVGWCVYLKDTANNFTGCEFECQQDNATSRPTRSSRRAPSCPCSWATSCSSPTRR